MHGPTELLPVSSSGHLVLVPAILDWPYLRLEPEVRKSFEVALHAGTAAALVIVLRREVARVLRTMDAARAAHVVLTFAPAAAAGLGFERTIEARLGGPRGVAIAQVGGGLALALADQTGDIRPRESATAVDHLLVGLAQATALAPGVSRNGATLTAARVRGFHRRAANELSRHAALPVIVGAAALKGVRLARGGLDPHLRPAFAVGAGAAFASTLACSGLIRSVDAARTFLPFAGYRVALGAFALALGGAERLPRQPSALRGG